MRKEILKWMNYGIPRGKTVPLFENLVDKLEASAYQTGVHDAMKKLESVLGPRCGEYEIGCPTCEVWEALSALTKEHETP